MQIFQVWGKAQYCYGKIGRLSARQFVPWDHMHLMNGFFCEIPSVTTCFIHQYMGQQNILLVPIMALTVTCHIIHRYTVWLMVVRFFPHFITHEVQNHLIEWIIHATGVADCMFKWEKHDANNIDHVLQMWFLWESINALSLVRYGCDFECVNCKTT